MQETARSEASGASAYPRWVCKQLAVTRVNPEQASKVMMRMPTRPCNGEGRSRQKTICSRLPHTVAALRSHCLLHLCCSLACTLPKV